MFVKPDLLFGLKQYMVKTNLGVFQAQADTPSPNGGFWSFFRCGHVLFRLVRDLPVDWRYTLVYGGAGYAVGFTIIPVPPSLDIRGWSETNPLNGPTWSLQWEYLANVLYALVFRRMKTSLLAVCVAVFAVMTVSLCLNIDIFGLLATRSGAAYTIVGGWSVTPEQLLVGSTRLLYPFFCGLLLSRLCWLVKVKGGFWWCSLMITAILCMPWMGLGTEGVSRWTNGLYEAVCIIIFFPLIVAIGAGSSVKGRKSEAANKFFGEISFPLYITHYPLIYMQMAWADNHEDAPLATHIFCISRHICPCNTDGLRIIQVV